MNNKGLMEENKGRQYGTRTKKLIEFSKKAPFFTSVASLFYETTNVLYSELKYRMLFFSLAEDEFGYPEIYTFEGKDLVSGSGSCKCYSKAQIIEFSQLLNSFDRPVLLPKERIASGIKKSGKELPEFLPETALIAPIKDRFGEKLGFMFLCSELRLEQEDLEFFVNTSEIVGTGLSVLEKLEQDDAFFDDHVAHSPIGFIKISDDYKILSVNDKFAQILGFENVKEFFSDENQTYVKRLERSRNLIQALLKLKKSHALSVEREMLAIDRFRNKRWLEIHGRYHISDSFANNFFEILVVDITDLKKLEREFSNLLILQDSLLNLSKDGIVIEDENGIILGINRILTDRYGKSPDFLIGKHISVLGGDKRTIQENIQILQDGKPHIQTIEHLTPDGKRYFYELSEQLIKFPNGNRRIVSYSRDITKQVGFEQKIIKLKTDLQKYKYFQTLFVKTVTEKKTEFFELIENINQLLAESKSLAGAEEILAKINLFKEEAIKEKITLDLYTAINFAFSDKENYKKSTFELNFMLRRSFFPRITKYLEVFGAEFNAEITAGDFVLETEKEVLLNLLKLIIESFINNKKFSKINFTVKEGTRRNRIIEITLEEDILSEDLLGKIFTPPSPLKEYYVYIPQLFSLAERTEVVLQSGEKTKIKINIS